MIALSLPDKDIGRFRLICAATNDAIDADHDRFWFLRWRDQYDSPLVPHHNHSETKHQYQFRKHSMKPVSFHRGHTRKEKDYLRVVKAIIVGKSISSFRSQPRSAMCCHVVNTDLR